MKEGWTYKSFQDCIVKIPKQKQVKSKDYKSSGLYPIVSQEKELISGYWDDESYVFKHEKPVIIFGDHTKEIKYIDFDFVVGADGTQLLQTTEDIKPKYFYYALLATPLRALGYARHYKLLKEKSFPIPSSLVQKRIVAHLDAAFSRIDALKANAEKQLNEARALFKRALDEAMTPREGWEINELNKYVLLITDGDHQPPPKVKTGIPFVTISNINKITNQINFEDTFYVPFDYYNDIKDEKKPRKGDVLYTVTGSFGIPVLIRENKHFCFQRHIGLIRPNANLLIPVFLFYWILSDFSKKQADEKATGAAQRTVSLSSLRAFKIGLPPLPEQRRIVARLDALSSNVRQLEENQRKVVAECAALKQAILRDVFE